MCYEKISLLEVVFGQRSRHDLLRGGSISRAESFCGEECFVFVPIDRIEKWFAVVCFVSEDGRKALHRDMCIGKAVLPDDVFSECIGHPVSLVAEFFLVFQFLRGYL